MRRGRLILSLLTLALLCVPSRVTGGTAKTLLITTGSAFGPGSECERRLLLVLLYEGVVDKRTVAGEWTSELLVRWVGVGRVLQLSSLSFDSDTDFCQSASRRARNGSNSGNGARGLRWA